MLLSAVSVLVVAQSSSEIPQGLMNNPVYIRRYVYTYTLQSDYRICARVHTNYNEIISLFFSCYVFFSVISFNTLISLFNPF